MPYMPIEDDPMVPDGSVLAASVRVDQYIRPDGTFGVRTWYEGHSPLTQVLGLLAAGGIDLYMRCNRDGVT